MFAVWRSCQHYSTPNALPDAQAQALETVLAAAPRLPSHGRARRFVGRLRNGEWVAVGFIDNIALVATTTAAQLEKYDKVRRGQINWSNDSYRPLISTDHPQRTIELDRGTLL